jgi:hypothetical protein
MTPKVKRTILFSVLGLFAIGAGVGYYLYNKKPLNPNNVSPDTKTTSTELYQAFARDTLAAIKDFSRKVEVVEVSGTVLAVSRNQDKQYVILLNTDVEGASVNCTMEGPAPNVTAGQTIRLKGFCTGMGAGDADLGIMADLYMIRCYLVK